MGAGLIDFSQNIFSGIQAVAPSGFFASIFLSLQAFLSYMPTPIIVLMGAYAVVMLLRVVLHVMHLVAEVL